MSTYLLISFPIVLNGFNVILCRMYVVFLSYAISQVWKKKRVKHSIFDDFEGSEKEI